MNTKNTIIIIALVLCVLVLGSLSIALWVYRTQTPTPPPYTNSQNNTGVVPSSTLDIEIIPDGSKKTVTLTKKNIRFYIPNEVMIDNIFDTPPNHLMSLTGKNVDTTIHYKPLTPTNDLNVYLDTLSTSTKTIGANIVAHEFISDGYCDGPGCGLPYIAYRFEGEKFHYIIHFSGDKKINSDEQLILDSIQID